MDSLVVIVSAVVLCVLAGAAYFWVLEWSGLFDGCGWDDEPETDEHEDNLGADR